MVIMEQAVQEAVVKPDGVPPKQLNWIEHPAVKQLLDVMVAIIVAEYVRTVKAHPAEFSVNGGQG